MEKSSRRHRASRPALTARRLLAEGSLLTYAVAVLAAMWMAAATVFVLTEGASLTTGLSWALGAAAGQGSAAIATAAGGTTVRVVQIGTLLASMIILISSAGIILEKTLERKPRAWQGMHHHVLVLGWNRRLERGVRELLNHGQEVLVIAEMEELPVLHPCLAFMGGDPRDDENIRQANASLATMILISGDNDTDTLFAALALKNVTRSVPSVCIVNDASYGDKLKRNGVNQILLSHQDGLARHVPGMLHALAAGEAPPTA
ncbi:MAG: NAD-binding protein [Candidatus Thermoplasmatota archaeon]|nr:NAD-binding protein [Candidatus Thermoplasmatota archaeon]MDD5778643.1 NAD-binding protein [Candidatus Thermoplasmatota archaeon]